MKRLLSRLLVAAALLLTGAIAQAQSTSQNFTVQANVAAGCTIVATPTLTFATAYDPAGANLAAALNEPTPASMSVRCTKGTAYTVTVGNGANYSAPNRRMANGTERLNYGLYSDSGYSTAWSGPSASVTSGSRAPVTYDVYGSIPANQDVAAGAYTDTVALTINW